MTLNARSLKDYVDFVAAQVRELKFGSAVPSVVSSSPPSAFAAAPRYFDRVGSVAGSRNATVSIGNGTTSFGDFNGTDEVPFIAAIAALPATGGSIHVKAGTYTFANQLSIATKPFCVVWGWCSKYSDHQYCRRRDTYGAYHWLNYKPTCAARECLLGDFRCVHSFVPPRWGSLFPHFECVFGSS